MKRSAVCFLVCVLSLLCAQRLFALDPARVLIVHADNPADRELANYYALKRGVPADHILPVTIQVSRFYLCGDYHAFQNDLITPIKLKLAQLGPTAIDVILLAGAIPPGITSAASCAGDSLETVSVDNVLMGLNYWDPATNNIVKDTNPYFDPIPSFQPDKGPFNHANYKFHGADMYLVSRLGSQSTVAGLEEIDQASYADRYLSPLPGYYNGNAYVDSRFGGYTDASLSASTAVRNGSYGSYNAADENIAYSEHFIQASGFPLKWENTAGSISIGAPGATWSDGTPALTAPRPLFYGGWYNPCCFTDVFDWLPGSVVTDLNSGPFFALYNGLARGATAVAYVIGEPLLNGIQRPHSLYYYILRGYSFAEASTLSTPNIGWMETNEGDPLYAPTRSRPLVRDTQRPVLSAGYPYDSLGATPTDRIINVMVNDFPEPEVVQVKVDYGTTSSYGSTADSWKGYWRRPQVKLSNLQPNTLYHYRLTLTDPVGNVTTTGDYTFHTGVAPPPPPADTRSTPPPATALPPDTTAPTVAIASPIANSTIFGLSTISGSAADNRGVFDVTIAVDGSILGSAIGPTAWTFVLDTSLVANGPHTLKVEATDGFNNKGSATLPIVVNNAGKAIYDPNLKVPRCSDSLAECDSHVLLNGRGRATGGIELHQPNTLLPACSDQWSGNYHLNESLDRLRVSTPDGSPFAAGKTVVVEASVWASTSSRAPASSDRLDLWYTADANNPSWTLIATLTPPAGGSNTLSASYVLPSGYLQAVRGVFRSGGVAGVCATGEFDDNDDLVFAVGPKPASSGSATFVTLDTVAQGTWKSVYGGDGYAINSDVTNYPAYAQVAITNALTYVWNPSTTDLRALQKGAAADRIASTWYTAGTFAIDLTITDGAAHQVALYAVDWDDNNTRTQTVEVRDIFGTLLDRRSVSTFGSGQYLVWNLSGHVRLTVINTGPNAVISGIFFGPSGTPPPATPPPSTPPPSSLPSPPWISLDVGAASPAGSATANGGAFTLTGAGDDIWGVADAFQFVYQPFSGDGQIVARVASVQNTNTWAKAGVMLRDTLTAGSRHAALLVSPTSGLAFERRTTTSGATVFSPAGGAAPQWIRLTRSGTTITAAQSTNGTDWTIVGTDTIALGASVYVGLVVTSHGNGVLCQAVFDNVSVATSAPNVAPTVTLTKPAGGATYTAPASIPLEATASDSDGIAKVEFYADALLIGTDTSAPYQGAWAGAGAGTYSITAKAYDALGAITVSSSASVTVSGAGAPSGLPALWTSLDVGAASPAGNATANGGAFTLTGAGDDIWGAADAFQFVYQPFPGDGQIVARVSSLQNTHAWAKAGVMVRETLAPDSRHAALLVSPTSGLAFERRATPGGATVFSPGGGAAPQWLRLTRSGTTITAAQSVNGTDWVTVGTDTIGFGTTVYVGLAVTSHGNGVLAQAVFDNVSVTTSASSGLPAAWISLDVGAASPAGSATPNGGAFTLTGAGDDIWGAADAFQFAYQPLTGDGQIVARVTALQNTHAWAKAGVMLRETLAADSRHAALLVSPTSGLAFERRAATGGATVFSPAGGAVPQWLRLTRSGPTVTAAQSVNGTDWVTIGTDTIGFGTNLYVGLAVTSHGNGGLCQASFDNVSVTASAPNSALTQP